jgi:hypothetical protein
MRASGAAPAASSALDSRSAFMRAVREVSSDLQRTSLKMAALTKLVKKRSMFEDASAEVERLTLSIKADMTSQSSRLDGLQDYILHKRHAAVAGGARPGKPLPMAPPPRAGAGAGAAAPAADSGPDLLSSIQGISHGDAIVGQLQGTLLGFTSSLKVCAGGGRGALARSRWEWALPPGAHPTL